MLWFLKVLGLERADEISAPPPRSSSPRPDPVYEEAVRVQTEILARLGRLGYDVDVASRRFQDDVDEAAERFTGRDTL